jgi:hypothetical protein
MFWVVLDLVLLAQIISIGIIYIHTIIIVIVICFNVQHIHFGVVKLRLGR